MSRRILVPDLLPETDYALRVRIKNGDEVSDWSPVVNFTTITDVIPPSLPTNVTWVASGDSFHAEWTTVTTNNEGDIIPITRYEVSLNNEAVILSVPQVVDSLVTFDLSFEQNRVLLGIDPSVILKVRSVDNKELKSAWTTPITATNPAPGPVTNLDAVGGSGVIDVSWTAPSDTDLIGYNAYIGATKIWTGNATRFVHTTFSTSPQTITVKAVDKFGQESTGVSDTATATNPFEVDTTAPDAPTGISATITTDTDSALTTYMDVSWTAVANPTNDLMGYQVRYRKGSSGDYEYINVSNSVTSARIRGLEPYVAYEASVQAFDFMSNYSGFPANVTANGATNSAPGQPAAPGVASNTLQIQVTPTGTLQAGGAMPADVIEYEVYASTTTGFTPASANMIGKIPVGPAMATTFPIPASGNGANQTWYVKIIARDKGGLASTASPQVAATPTLIAATNIADATITNAKIASLAADKITAGTGLVADLTVKSTLTLGDASTDGIIRSYDYVTSSGATGYQMTKNSLVIKTGTIQAAALAINIGGNLVKPEYADFESNPAWFPLNMFNSGGTATPSRELVAKFNSSAVSVSFPANTSNPIIWLGTSTTNYNILVEAGETYIFSGYFWNKTAINTNVQFKVKWSTGAVSTITTATLTANTTPATGPRLQGTVVAPAGATGCVLYVESSTLTVNAGWCLDGVQVEKKTGTVTTASAWMPPSSTTIDGGLIKTGQIRSTNYQTTDLTQPVWSIDLDGNAVFSRMQILGGTVVGMDEADTESVIQSSNYLPGSAGWQIRGTGFAEFRQILTGSIDPDVLGSGVLVADSTIELKGAIEAYGVNGEVVGFSSAGFYSRGPDELGVITTFIEFPTDGKPNIISGVLNADTLNVEDGAFLNGENYVQDSSSLILASNIVAPASAAVATVDWETYALSFVAGRDYKGATQGHDGHIYVAGYYTTTSGGETTGRMTVRKFNSSTNAAISEVELFNEETIYTLVVPNNTYNFNYTLYNYGITYIPNFNGAGVGLYAIIYRRAGTTTQNGTVTSSTDNVYIRLFNTSMVAVGTEQLLFTNTNRENPSVGRDHINDRLVVGWKNISGGYHTYQKYSFNGTSLVADGGNINTGTQMGGANITALGAFDLGATRLIWANNSATTKSFCSFDLAAMTNHVANEQWLTGANIGVKGSYWNTTTSRFESIGADNKRYIYYGGSNTWSGANTVSWGFKYSWWDSTGTNYETARSPILNINMIRRARLRVTIPRPIPYSSGATNTPNRARLYRSVAGGAYGYFGFIEQPGRTWELLGTTVSLSGAEGSGGSTFPAVAVPGKITGVNIQIAGDGVWQLGELTGDATGAVSLTGADSYIPNDATWVTPTLNSPFTNGAQTVRYLLDAAGNVHLRGMAVRNSAADGAVIFTLPTGYRPQNEVRWTQDTVPVTTSSCRVLALANGEVRAYAKEGTPTTYHLDGVFAVL